MLTAFVCVLIGYLCGSASTAIIVCRALNLPDPRSTGSRNPGATNVLRIGGKKAALLTLIGDFAKGVLPVLLAKALDAPPAAVALTGCAAFLGHLYPVFFGFIGGKGVATAFGVILGLSWQVALAALATWLAMAFIFRISSLAALTAAVLAPLYLWWFALPGAYVAAVLAMVPLLVWRHRSNIRKLLDGTEGRIGEKKKSDAGAGPGTPG
ncbi:acyl-phosphate glycerol-3-phosphate acyltransferase [Plasticicumulans lactativorans]|uniref:Glycerol-3-phosphate acyltransferase n=1 Tax=Plasticicumulans lactativorans TaxID=1133106 RepID=A0A4R2LRF9_9GAMM|nr:glycerol-3-phosphate 1-O-acyltransferase PlsY [Plasticicumulans lactativorans]TCO82225.1 acyl-phosphate glycerol-3-phosphate acyltransferase [Plasticicumulans lactativorans]